MMDAFVPGTITSLKNIGIAADGELYAGVRTPKKDLETEVIRNALGIPTKLMRPEQIIYFAGGSYQNKASETTRPKLKADVEGEDYVEDMKTRYENLYSYQQDLYMSVDAVLTQLGPAKAQELLADQVGKKAAFSILSNRFYLPEVPELEEFLRLKNVTADEAIRFRSEVIKARNQAVYTRLIRVEEEEGPDRSAFKKGGEVLIPQAPDEPDERIDKMTGRPYIEQAGGAFTDEEDRSGGITRRFAVAKGGKIDKKKMACNKPKRTASHPKKSHVVKACKDGKEKIIRFGEQGAKTAGKPKAGESKRMKAKRKSFKARHGRNIKKGNMSAAYWADKVKW